MYDILAKYAFIFNIVLYEISSLDSTLVLPWLLLVAFEAISRQD
jgi:hypothetical protein